MAKALANPGDSALDRRFFSVLAASSLFTVPIVAAALERVSSRDLMDSIIHHVCGDSANRPIPSCG